MNDKCDDGSSNLVQNLGPLCTEPDPEQVNLCWKNALSRSNSRKVIKRPLNQHRVPEVVLPQPASHSTSPPQEHDDHDRKHSLERMIESVDTTPRKPLVTKYVSIWPRLGHGEYDVFVGNLDCCISASTLASWFEPFANVLHARIITDHSSGQSRGFGFVTFGSEPSMNRAILALNGTEQAGKIIRVEQSAPKVFDPFSFNQAVR